MQTIGQRLDESRGLGQGFDLLRVGLAMLVIYNHSWVVVGLKPQLAPVMWFTSYWVLAVFFGLSGFLITGSALRLSINNFLVNRGIRIFPALIVDIVFTAFVIGPIVTELPLKEYFANRKVYTFFVNVTGWIHYYLPGVFNHNPLSIVNLSLWTVPYELTCYAIMTLLIVTGALRRSWAPLLSAAAITIMGCILAAASMKSQGGHFERMIYAFVAGSGSRLFVCFLLGISAFHLRYRLPYSVPLFCACIVWCTGISIFVDPNSLAGSFAVLNAIAACPLIYIMAFIGVSPIPRLPFFHRGDYSYGMYLYGFPYQQIVFSLVPGITSPSIQFAMALPFIVGFAVFSWHFIEKPILSLRRRFSFVARQRIAESEARPELAGAECDPPLQPR